MADNETAVKFWHKHHDDKFLSVVLWHPEMGHYCGYLGRLDGAQIPSDTQFHYGEAVGGMYTQDIPQIEGLPGNIRVNGFDTAHGHDYNTGPNGEVGFPLNRSWGYWQKRDPDRDIVWTKDKVFKRLHDVADNILLKDQELEGM